MRPWLRVKTRYSQMQPFARLKAKVKPEIISFRIDDGLRIARKLLLDINHLGLPVGCE